MTKKVLVTGSRDFTDVSIIQSALADERPGSMLVIHGGARGADSIAGQLARDAYGVHEVIVPALWDKNGKRAAGPMRNAAMLDLKPDVVLAFFKQGAANIGSNQCVREAEYRHILVKEFWQ